jgi:hypothetical protein
MGKSTRSGFGYGMDEYDARRNFREELNRTYGEDIYQGGGNDIREWLCVQKPVPASAPNKTKSAKVKPKGAGKLVNGFIVTNETPDLLHRQVIANHSNIPAPLTFKEYTLTQAEAKKKANDMAMKQNTPVYVLPARLWQDDRQRLSLPQRALEVTPNGGKEAQLGKWRFEVEVAT